MGLSLVVLALYQLLWPPRNGARSFPSVNRISYTPESFAEVRFFGADGTPLIWYYRAEEGTYELFEGPGRHPRYGTNLQPITGEVVRILEQAVQRPSASMAALSSASQQAAVPTLPSPRPSARPVRAAPARVQRRDVEIPAGTPITIVLAQAIATDRDQADQGFTGTLAEPLVVEGLLVAPGNAEVVGRIVSLQEATKGTRATITLQVEQVQGADRTRLSIASAPLVIQAESASKLKKGLKVIGGAIVGALAGGAVGGKEGAKKGAILGTGVGVAVAVVSRGKSIEIPARFILPFQTERAMTVSLVLDATEHYAKRSAEDH